MASYHIVDGAYVDNEGAVTSVDWIHRLLEYYSDDSRILTRRFDRILVLRIQAFPKQTSTQSEMVEPTSGWRSALAGPIEAMMRVRSTSQIERSDLEIGLLQQANKGFVAEIRQRNELQYQQAQQQLKAAREAADDDERLSTEKKFDESYLADLRDRAQNADSLQLVPVLFDFPPSGLIPLSWKLTKSQKRSIDQAWERMVNEKDLELAKTVIKEIPEAAEILIPEWICICGAEVDAGFNIAGMPL